MNSPLTESKPVAESSASVETIVTAFRSQARLRWFVVFAIGLTLAFALPLGRLIGYALRSDLHSHMVLIPLVSGYLVWLKRRDPLPRPAGSPALAMIPLAFGLVALNAWFTHQWNSPTSKLNDYLALTSFAYVCLLWAGMLALLGGRWLKEFAFPALFLIFIVPLPTVAEHGIEVFFQYTSAEAAALLFHFTGSTVFRDGMVFQLPGISIRVAEECSGIRSSLVLFITSLVAGHMFLRSPWRRAALAFFVIPLAILRNGLRIFTIAMLCVHVSPDMIDSVIHHRGGPVFFGLSLIPFFALLLWLRRREMRKSTRQPE
jgi:exosortase C (VPDSG-CTERM-specific)